MKKVALHNLGCKVNSYEMDVMQQKLQERGYEIVPFDTKADIYIVNTCTVTNIADRKSRQMLHRAKTKNPQAVVVAVGCYVQTGGEQALRDTCIDLAVGNNRKKDLVEILEDYLRERELWDDDDEATAAGTVTGTKGMSAVGTVTGTDGMSAADTVTGVDGMSAAGTVTGADGVPTVGTVPGADRVSVSEPMPEVSEREMAQEPRDEDFARRKTLDHTTVIDINKPCAYEEMKLSGTVGHTRAYIKIQDGCNQFCSYCIIPYARGRVRSRKPDSILEEIRDLVAVGYKEVVLTGIHISSYGIDFAGEGKGDSSGYGRLIDLVERIQEIQGLERIRLGSLEPRIMTPDHVRRLAALPKLCPHFHLSLQSGCDETLKRMNRHYTCGEYYEKVELLRESFSHPAITTDVIAGFPGETQEEFEATCRFLEKVGFYEMHVFKYSMRKGTRAAAMADQVPEPLKASRSSRLLEISRRQSRELRKDYIGKEAEVLFEETKVQDGRSYWLGHTKDYVLIALETHENLSNCIRKVFVTDFLTDEVLRGQEIQRRMQS